jgi:ribosomal-protein-alanine N-acetyltransferase
VTELPEWPATAPAYGSVLLRPFTEDDVPFVIELGTDPYIPLVGSLPANPGEGEALVWIHRQLGRLAEGRGLSFAVADAQTGRAVGAVGLWLRNLAAGRASVGYSVAPSQRGRGIARDALCAVTGYAWTLPQVHRIELYIEPWNTASLRTAESAGYRREGLLRSYLEIGGTRRDMFMYAAVRTELGPPPG